MNAHEKVSPRDALEAQLATIDYAIYCLQLDPDPERVDDRLPYLNSARCRFSRTELRREITWRHVATLCEAAECARKIIERAEGER